MSYLKGAGVDYTVSALFDDSYIKQLQINKYDYFAIIKSYYRRIRCMMSAFRYDALWVEKDLLPWLPHYFEKIFIKKDVPYVVDYDDAVYHNYDMSGSAIVRAVLGKKYSNIMRRASLVVVGNEYIADYARQSGASRIELIPSVVNVDRYIWKQKNNDEARIPVVGWVGQRSSVSSLIKYRSVFEKLIYEKRCKVVAVGIDAKCLNIPIESKPWSEELEADIIADFDIGIMPLSDEPFERGKCGYKLIQYMAAGLPVIASPVGVNVKIVENDVNGFLSKTHEEWESSLRALISDKVLRYRLGSNGRSKVEKYYDVKVMGPKIVEIIKSVI
ncbi:glycosyltransferase family 4 protein [bacterium]|nr:glycosyltransferase family 4 protein [bacterium]